MPGAAPLDPDAKIPKPIAVERVDVFPQWEQGIVIVSIHERFAIRPVAVPMPAPLVEAIYHSLLSYRLTHPSPSLPAVPPAPADAGLRLT